MKIDILIGNIYIYIYLSFCMHLKCTLYEKYMRYEKNTLYIHSEFVFLNTSVGITYLFQFIFLHLFLHFISVIP